jgi:hypothetical protein
MLSCCTGALVWSWGIVGVLRVYEGDQEFEMPTVVSADVSIQQA